MTKRYDRWTRLSAASLAVLFVAFGAVTLVRSAYQKVRKTDLTVYLRAAWAARTGEDIYAVTDEHGWHYHYPPTLAAALVPLAQPPAGVDARPLVPYPTVVVLWYVMGAGCVLGAVGLLTPAVGTAGLFRDGRYRRWLLHAPVWVLLPAIASTLGRGQLNALLLLMLAGMTAAAVRGSSFSAGVWLAGAISLKVFPAFLLIVPLVRRDWKWLGGCAAGLLVGLVLVPAAVVGPVRTAELYRDWVRQVARPGLTEDVGNDRSHELLGMTATDNQSIGGTLHNLINIDRATRPKVAAPATRAAHWFLGALLTAVTLTTARRSPVRPPHREALTLGALSVPMLLSCPVCHLHYFILLLPLCIALVATHLAHGQRVRPALIAVLILNFFTSLFPRLPGLEYARDIGLASFGALALWAAALIELNGEAILRVRLPGYRKARAFWSRKRLVTVHAIGDGTRTVATPRRRRAG
jgi:hypothetical protein